MDASWHLVRRLSLLQVRKSDEVLAMFGDPLKAYGIDHGGNREGRRNFIQSRESVGEDGSKRVKVRFNLQGPFGGGIVFAEVSDQLDPKSGEWVYLIVQSKRTGQAITLCDNRQAIAASAHAKTPEVRAGSQDQGCAAEACGKRRAAASAWGQPRCDTLRPFPRAFSYIHHVLSVASGEGSSSAAPQGDEQLLSFQVWWLEMREKSGPTGRQRQRWKSPTKTKTGKLAVIIK